MAIILLASKRYTGLSTDTKPTTNIETGSLFTETDTGKIYTWDGATWNEIPTDHANIQPGNIHVPYDFTFPDAASRIAASYVSADLGKFIRQLDTEDIYMVLTTGPTFVKISGSGSGEPNTASNVGAGGIGLYKQKTGIDLEFKNLNSSDGTVQLTDDTGDDEVELSVDGSNVDHDNLSNVTSDQHHPQVHASTHILGGTDEVDGDTLGIDYIPTNYVRTTTPPQVTSTNELTAHLAGIDNAVSSALSTQVGNKQPVRLATVAVLPAYTVLGSGVGKKLQANAVGALTLDTINPIVDDRVLIKNETGAGAINNGIYVVTNPGDGSNQWELTRASDYDQDEEVIGGHLVSAQEGATNADEVFILTTNEPIVIDSSQLIYDSLKLGITSVTPIAPAANIPVDSVLLSQFHTAKWVMDIYDATAGDRESSEVLARENNLNTQFSQTNIIGDTLTYTISFTSNGVSMLFNILNSGTNSITVRLRKLEA